MTSIHDAFYLTIKNFRFFEVGIYNYKRLIYCTMAICFRDFTRPSINSEWLINQEINVSQTPQGQHRIGGKDEQSRTAAAKEVVHEFCLLIKYPAFSRDSDMPQCNNKI